METFDWRQLVNIGANNSSNFARPLNNAHGVFPKYTAWLGRAGRWHDGAVKTIEIEGQDRSAGLSAAQLFHHSSSFVGPCPSEY